jgi:hypothetical protein
LSWFPIGPDFVFAPSFSFLRLSLRNEQGRQGVVTAIEIDPTDPATIYVAERPSNGGSSVFRTRNGGRTWTPLTDSLHQDDPNVDTTCIAVNPSHPEILYMATTKASLDNKAGFFASSNRGEPGSWSPRRPLESGVRKLLVDPRTAATPSTTVIYAATELGLFRSTDGGATWPPSLFIIGDAWDLQAHFPASGQAQFYAAVRGKGVFHAEDSNIAQQWRNLNEPLPSGASTGLPAPGSFDGILIGLCVRNPSRLYAWLMTKKSAEEAMTRNDLWTTTDPKTTWTSITMSSPPNPWQGYRSMSFAVAPNSPGDGLNDILLFGSLEMHRSIDSGRSWKQERNLFHADQHAIAFSPARPVAGEIPAVYIGCDGGVAKSSGYANPAFDITSEAQQLNQLYEVVDSGYWQNLNHGKQSSAVYQYASPPEAPALSYIGVQDTGINGGGTALGWRAGDNGDGGAIGAATAADGVRVWGKIGLIETWPALRFRHWLDKGEYIEGKGDVTCGPSLLAATSNCENGPAGTCVAGGVIRTDVTSLAQAVAASPNPQDARPTSLAGIVAKAQLSIDPGTGDEEVVEVIGVTATTFSAKFTKPHAQGAPIALHHAHAVRMDGAVATAISQDFMPEEQVVTVAVGGTDRKLACLATNRHRVFTTNQLDVAGPTTQWMPTTGLVAGLPVADLTVTKAGTMFLLAERAIAVAGTPTVLFRLDGTAWTALKSPSLPGSVGEPHGQWFGKLVADPLEEDLLYASNGARVFRVARSGDEWSWTEISEGLPGQWIYDLTARAMPAGHGGPAVMLRVGIPTRGVFERDARQAKPDPKVSLYVRDHLLDSGWGDSSENGVVNPYRPNETLWHYMCADIKNDAHEIGPASSGNFFQTDPEGNPIPPLDHIRFDQLRDDSNNLPQSDTARLHVQVHNRSHLPSGDVTVWAIYCPAAAGPSAFNVSPSQGDNFPFWRQFHSDGTIVPSLPPDSPWVSVGPPQVLNGIEASEPKVASWTWTVPALPWGDPGHFCMAVFVHSADSPIDETERMSINELAPGNRQIGQKNLHIGPPLPLPPGSPGIPPASGTPGAAQSDKQLEYVEFHNASGSDRSSDLVFDLRRVPPSLAVSLQLTPVQTPGPLVDSLIGVANSRPATPADIPPKPFEIPVLSALWALIVTIVCWLVNLVRKLFGRPTRPCRRPRVKVPDFEPVVHEAESGKRVAVQGVLIPAFGFAAALIAIEPVAPMQLGDVVSFDVQQWDGTTLEGGGHYVVRIEGEKPPPELLPPAPATMRAGADRAVLRQLEREAEQFPTIPPFAHRLVEQRESELERR